VRDEGGRVEHDRVELLVADALVGAATADLGLPLRPIRSVRQDAGGGQDRGQGTAGERAAVSAVATPTPSVRGN
jgi:hypothetical protein